MSCQSSITLHEQKAVIVLLALLHLGVKNIHLGPTLPAFLSPEVVQWLKESYGIKRFRRLKKIWRISVLRNVNHPMEI